MTDQVHLTEEMIQRFVDGSAEEPEVIRRHLETCAKCGRAVRAQEQLARMVRRELLLKAPERVKEAVLREIRVSRRFAATARLSTVLSTAFAGAVALGVLGGGYWMITASKTSSEDGLLGTAMRQASSWVAPAMGGINSFLSSVASAVLSGQQLIPTLLAVVLAFAGVALMDLLVRKRLVRR